MIGTLVVWSTLLGGIAEVSVSPMAGPALRGQLTRLGDNQLVLRTADAEESFRFDQLRRVEFAADSPPVPGMIQVELTDGSILRGTGYTVSDSQATLQVDAAIAYTIPTRAIDRVLFRDHSGDGELQARWEDLSGTPGDQDRLIYRRETDGAVTLDSLLGVLYDVREEDVDFLFDGERLSPRRTRIEGFVYFHPASTADPRPTICLVDDRYGSRWHAAGLRLSGERLELETVSGVHVELPVERLRALDFTAGNLVYLSDLEPEQVSWRPFIDSRLPQSLLATRYAPRRDQGFDGGPLQVGGESFEKGLSLRSQTELVYRVGSDFRRFQARVGMDEVARTSAVTPSLRLVVSGDDQVLWEEVLQGTDTPRDLDVELTGVRRLKITVDFGDDLDIADFLNLADARFSK